MWFAVGGPLKASLYLASVESLTKNIPVEIAPDLNCFRGKYGLQQCLTLQMRRVV